MIKRSIGLLAILTLFMAARSAAASDPPVVGQLSGVEICPQSICGAAVFTGTFQGTIRGFPTAGFFWVAAQHESLPTPGNTAGITGGRWNISTPTRFFRGRILGGTIFNNGDNTFTIDVTLDVRKGGSGRIDFLGTLDHNVFPPTIEGALTQP